MTLADSQLQRLIWYIEVLDILFLAKSSHIILQLAIILLTLPVKNIHSPNQWI